MPSFTSTMVSFTTLLAVTSAAPTMLVARDVCGTSGSGTGTAPTPLSTPSGVTTAAACLASCDSASSCLSFLFGLLNGEPTCELFSVAASQLPATTNFVAYDKTCSSVPSIVPTTSNPTGVDVSGDQSTGSTSSSGTSSSTDVSGDQSTGSQTSTAKNNRGVNADNSGDPSTGSTGSKSGSGSSSTGLTGPATAPTVVSGATHASPQQGIPAAGQAVLAKPTAANLAACLAACKAEASCISYVFQSNQCYLYA